jgi:GT2 family glycosyltransferase
MKAKSPKPASSPAHEAEFSRLVRSFTQAHGAGDSATALRSIDRAWRMAPRDPETNFLYGRLQLDNGAIDQAIKLFAVAVAGRAYPDYEAAYIAALCLGGQTDLAQQRLEAALKEFAVIQDGALARAARQVAIAAAPPFPGWIGVGPDLKLHGELVAQTGTVKLEIAGDSSSPRIERIKCETDRSCVPFTIPTDRTAPAHLTARIHDRILLGGKLDFPPDFGLDGRVTLSKGTFSGRVTLKWDPSRPLSLIVSGANGFSTPLPSTPDPAGFDRQIFSFEETAVKAAGNTITISAILPDGSQGELPASPFLIRPSRPPAVRGRPSLSPAGDSVRPAIDIVIPVYSGVDETLTCIQSVIATTKGRAEIIVINDASPDRDMAATLASLEAAGTITLLHNPRNLGFPATANRGLLLHPDRDVVLLNADTEVYADWLVRLQAAAYGAPQIATVTPLTNSGSIASYPSSEDPNLPPGQAVDLDQLAARANRGVTIDIPTGVGFCMYIRRASMDQVGVFDAELFSKGYGEENDFCMRAAKAGWKHVLAADIYVRHAGSRSFGGRRAALYERNLRLLNLKHRGYNALVQKYLKQDPAHPARRRLDQARLTDAGERYALLVSLGLDGGVSRAVQDRLAAIRKTGLKTILLTPTPEDIAFCTLAVDEPGFDDLRYNATSESNELVSWLQTLTLERVELHHFLDLSPALVERLFSLGRPVDVTIHDYVWYCPRITLLDKSRRYCGEPDIATCELCVKENGSRLNEGNTVAALRERSARWLRSARNITVPSPSVAKRITAQFPGLKLQVESLEEDVPPPVPIVPKATKTDRVKVALIGAIGDHKGYAILLAMAKDAAKRNLPLDFIVIGYTQGDRALMNTGRVFITGYYEDAEVEGLIARESPDVILFLSVFPESWCYTLTHALRANIPVAGLDLGAIADRLRGTAANDMLFPLSSSPASICDRLLATFTPLPYQDRIATRPLSSRNGSSGLPRKPDILSSAPPLPEAAKISRTTMAPTSTEPTASVSFLPLAQGLYLFSVRSGQRTPQAGEQITLPAMQVAAAPGTAAGQVELMMGARTTNGWLIDWNDQIIAKVTGPSVLVALTSVLVPGMTPLEIEVQRLDQAPPANAGNAVDAQQSPQISGQSLPPPAAPQNSLQLRVVAHVQNRGDIAFHESEWAGLPEQRLWIESISISPLEGISSDMIEYKAITATGVETPWVAGGSSCGTRGIGVPITGFALRVKPQSGAPRLTCEYGAICLSGTTIGPTRNGVPCYSADANDPITGIWVAITGKSVAAPALSGTTAPKKPQKAKSSRRPVTQADTPVDSTVNRKKAKIGPRFSVFREPNTSEHE